MRSNDQKQASPVERAAQIFALSLGFAGASLPAAAQNVDPKRDGPVPAVAPITDQLDLENATLPSVFQETATAPQVTKPISQIATDATLQPEKQSPWSKLLSTVSGALSMVTMGWYFSQIRRKETAVSVPSIGLQGVNDSLLCVAAVVNQQGWGAIATAAVFSLGGIACVREALKTSEKENHFRTRDYLCAAGCVLGWSALIASWTPQVSAMFGKETLGIAGSWIATGTYILAGLPMMREMLLKPTPSEIKTNVERPLLALVKTVGPYLCGTTALGLAVATVPEFNWATAPQTIGLFVNNLFLLTFISIWGARRISSAARSS